MILLALRSSRHLCILPKHIGAPWASDKSCVSFGSHKPWESECDWGGGPDNPVPSAPQRSTFSARNGGLIMFRQSPQAVVCVLEPRDLPADGSVSSSEFTSE